MRACVCSTFMIHSSSSSCSDGNHRLHRSLLSSPFLCAVNGTDARGDSPPPPWVGFRAFAEFLSLSQRPITSWLFCFARKGLMGGGPPFSRPLPSLVVIMRPAFGKSQAWRAAVGKGGRSLGGAIFSSSQGGRASVQLCHTRNHFSSSSFAAAAVWTMPCVFCALPPRLIFCLFFVRVGMHLFSLGESGTEFFTKFSSAYGAFQVTLSTKKAKEKGFQKRARSPFPFQFRCCQALLPPPKKTQLVRERERKAKLERPDSIYSYGGSEQIQRESLSGSSGGVPSIAQRGRKGVEENCKSRPMGGKRRRGERTERGGISSSSLPSPSNPRIDTLACSPPPPKRKEGGRARAEI